MKRDYFLIILLNAIMFHAASLLMAQHREHESHAHGRVLGFEYHATHADTIPLIGANIYWKGTSIGTITDSDGHFHLDRAAGDHADLIVSFVAYKNDTLHVHDYDHPIIVILHQPRTIKSVEVSAEKPHIHQMADNVQSTQRITMTGLRTLACCNLSESFENTASVDVENNDAISGAKRIKMLGLAGFYTQVLIEKKPVIRGLVAPFALDYIPGPWMESIDISKGTASVMTGYESTTGQINVEYRKPERGEPLFFNVYQSSMGRTESSLGASHRFNPSLSTMVLAYGHFNRTRHDANHDSFMDAPLANHLHLQNRWKLQPSAAWDGQLGASLVYDHRDGGQSAFDFDYHEPHPLIYGFHTKIQRTELFAKVGRALDAQGTSSIGMIFSGFRHANDAFWGVKNYRGDEASVYGNLILQKTAGAHDVAAGFSILVDNLDENFNGTRFENSERVPGAFVEYTLHQEKWTGIAGFRYDRHSRYGDFYTPRFHLKYLLAPTTTLRLSAGKGYRSAHIFMEQLAILASSRSLNFVESLRAEEAWNYGIQVSHNTFITGNRSLTVALDFYRTSFQNRVIVDSEQAVGQIFVYNLLGQSFSNSAQVEVIATLFPGLETTLAWRWNDVRMTINNQLLEEPLSNRHKGLLVLTYTPPAKRWQFDLTTQWNGEARLPSTALNPGNYQTASHSRAYVMLLGQIKRKIRNLEFYIGLENITNFTQSQPILAWQEPFSPYFDSSMIWGPTVGRQIYAGIRVN